MATSAVQMKKMLRNQIRFLYALLVGNILQIQVGVRNATAKDVMHGVETVIRAWFAIDVYIH